jgi:hypothetical protein
LIRPALDPVMFPSLHPLAYHYFAPGVLLGLLGLLLLDGVDLDWAMVFVPPRGHSERFRAAYLPLFDPAQRMLVGQVLAVVDDALAADRGYGDAGLQRAITAVWAGDGTA